MRLFVHAACLVLALLIARGQPPLELAASRSQGATLARADASLVLQAKPHDPAPPESRGTAAHLPLPPAALWARLARRWPRVVSTSKPTVREHRGTACVHVPRRRIPRLRDDADGP